MDLSSQTLDVRLMTKADVPRADELRRVVGWNQRPQDWRRLLSLEPNGCFVALVDGALVGTVTTTVYDTALAWIGMMLVHPEHRRKGIATRLMDRALEHLKQRQVPTVKLDATPAGQPLYSQLGFVVESTLQRWQREAHQETAVQIAVPQIREISGKDWDVIIELDTAAFGIARRELLQVLARESRCALVWAPEGEVLGFGFLRPGSNSEYLGPLVCRQTDGLKALLSGLFALAGSQCVTWDISDQNEHAKSAALENNFKPVRPLTRMCLGPALKPAKPETLFGIADPAVG